MIKTRKIRDSRGFTLIEILLSLVILGVITYFTIGISRSIQNMNKVIETKKEMKYLTSDPSGNVLSPVRAYYDSHERLPGEPGTHNLFGDIHGNDSYLDPYLEQKYRMDAWGQYYEYYYVTKDTEEDSEGNSYEIHDITGLRVDGTVVAAVLISYGPNNLKDYISEDNEPSFPDRPWQYELTTAGDEILYGINVNDLACNHALEELATLQDKVNQYMDDDDPFDDNDDNGNGTTDENGCVPAAGMGCPLEGGFTFTNDPSCVEATLDVLYQYSCSYPWDTVLSIIIDHYKDDPTELDKLDEQEIPKYQYDPWGRLYLWGDNSSPTHYRYRTFYSSGKDQISDKSGSDSSDVNSDDLP